MSLSSDYNSTASPTSISFPSIEISPAVTPWRSKSSLKNVPTKVIPFYMHSIPFHPEEVKLMSHLIPKVRHGIRNRHIIPDDISDHQIAHFLNVDLNVEKALALMEKHFTFKLAHPHLFSKNAVANLDTSIARSFLTVVPFPNATDEGYQLIYVGFRSIMEDKVDFLACSRFLVLAVESLLISTGILPGQIIILDVTHASENIFGEKKIPEYQNILTYLQECTALKIIEIIILNVGTDCKHEYIKYLEPWILEETDQKTIYPPYGIKNLLIEFGTKILPKELGGTCGTLKEFEEEFYKTLQRCQDWFYSQQDDPYGFNLDKSC